MIWGVDFEGLGKSTRQRRDRRYSKCRKYQVPKSRCLKVSIWAIASSIMGPERTGCGKNDSERLTGTVFLEGYVLNSVFEFDKAVES